MSNTQQYEERLKRVEDAIALKEPDALPMAVRVSGAPYFLYEDIGASHSTDFYDFAKSAEAFIRYHEEFKPDVRSTLHNHTDGKTNEIAEPKMIDWPGRPGSAVPAHSTFQVLEEECMLQEEYDEMTDNYTDFIMKKFIPRAFPKFKAFENFSFDLAVMIGPSAFSHLLKNDVKTMLLEFIKMIDTHEVFKEDCASLDNKLDEMGYPPLTTGGCLVPYDFISDHFRGVMGIFEDLIEVPDKILRACNMIADRQIAALSYLERAPMRIKRVFFPLHKGMDGFMSPKEYHELYWEPYQRVLKYLVGIGATPFIYTEGPYASRVDYIRERLQELPKGTCVIHFEQGDFADLKKKFEGIACLTGGMPLYDLEYGKKEDVVDRVKYIVDNCAAGGGYMLNGGASFEKVKRENFEAMFETARTYGKK